MTLQVPIGLWSKAEPNEKESLILIKFLLLNSLI